MLVAPARADPVRRDAGAVFRDLAPPVHGYLRAAGVDDADDLLGEVFVAVTDRLAGFDGDDDALRRWVFTIAHHKLVDHRRRAARRRLLRVPWRGVAPPPDEPFDPGLVAALRQLTVEQREVITLRFVADLPLEAVAGITRRPVGAVKAMQHRALEQLRRLVPEPQPPR
jgi:RNA polymerase sigma-70 factor (ECF subfamily)